MNVPLNKGGCYYFRYSLGALLGLLTAFSAAGEETFMPLYFGEGIFKYSQRIDRAESEPQFWTFRVARDAAKRWQIEIHAERVVSGITINADDFLIYDGTNTYTLTRSDIVTIVPTKPSRIEKIGGRDVASVLNICAGPYPIDSSSVAGIVWLAYIAGEELDPALPRTRLPNLTVSNARTDPLAWSCDFAYELTEDTASQLLKRGEYVINPQLIGRVFADYDELDEPSNGVGEKDRSMFQKFNYIRSLETETSAAVYTLDQFTNINGATIPTRFHVEVPVKLFGHGTNGYSRFEGSLTNFQPIVSGSLFPDLTPNVTVRDRRFRVKDQGAKAYREEIVYAVTNRIWPTDTNDARIQALAKDLHAGWRKVYSGPLNLSQRISRYFRWVLILGVAFPIAFLAWRRKGFSSRN